MCSAQIISITKDMHRLSYQEMYPPPPPLIFIIHFDQ